MHKPRFLSVLLIPMLFCAGCAGTALPSASVSEEELFTERDLRQEADLSNAVYLTLSDGCDITIDEAGVYVLSGEAKETALTVDAPEDAKVQLVLDNIRVSNTVSPFIAVKSADKVFITTADGSDSTIETGSEAAILSDCDLTMNGQGTLAISSGGDGVVTKDDLRITGGTYIVEAADCGFTANDSIAVNNGVFEITAGNDAFHSEHDSDDTLGYIVIKDGTFTLQAGDDAIHGQSTVSIEGGSFEIDAAEGIESTAVTVSGGSLHISAVDDGLNAGHKSDSVPVSIVISGGIITIDAAGPQTDAVDANGDIVIKGGTLVINTESAFDFDGSGTIEDGTVIINGETVSELISSDTGAEAE